MTHKKIRIPKESAIAVMEELGKLDDSIQFVDLNTHDYEQRKNFGSLIERCEEALHNIQNFENIVEQQNKKIIKYTFVMPYLLVYKKIMTILILLISHL